jgi:cobyric acid synthase CobQ
MKSSIKKPVLMIQGTTSNAGKSILVTAFCRIFTRYGLNVSPFKAQNMSLNSFVTPDNLEIGRAQAIQAMACKKDCDVRMNPILLKPDSHSSSQIVVMGKPLNTMRFRDYSQKRCELEQIVHKAYDELAEQSDLMILEGAGSPAEVNLKKNDIVNMAMAKYAGANVLICGDIDRGGVYAHFLGTYMCLDSEEQQIVKGFLVNKFRGDQSLLGNAHGFIMEKTSKPVLGVIPYVDNLIIPDEDSVSFKEMRSIKQYARSADTASVKIAYIDLPYISNANDIDPFKYQPDVHIDVISAAADLDKHYNAIIIPGTKNVIHDLQYLHKNGFSGKLYMHNKETAAIIVGICGGFQMLGTSIEDPYNIESELGFSISGLGLLDITTTLERDKTLAQTCVRDSDMNTTYQGYEIHHGKTEIGPGSIPVHFNTYNEAIGAKSSDNRVWGTYLHGIFENDIFRNHFIDMLRQRKNLGNSEFHIPYQVDKAIDVIADTVEQTVDMETIKTILGL